MEYGWDLNDTESFGSLSRDFHYASMLINEIMAENLADVRRLLEVNQASPNTVVPERGAAALHILAGMENEDFATVVCLMALLKSSGDPNVRSEDGLTPVHVAAMWGRCRLLEVLLSNGGDPLLLDYEKHLNAEDYALREHQWRAYGILATFSIIVDDTERFAKYLDEEAPTGHDDATLTSSTGTVENNTKYEAVASGYDDRSISDDYDWCRQTVETIPLGANAINTINNHRRNMRIYQSPDEDSDEECRPPDAPKLPKRNAKKQETKREDSEVYFCGFSESSYKSKDSTGRRERGSYRSEFSGSCRSETGAAGWAKEPSNRMLCKMSRIFLFMLKKRHTYQRIK